MKCSLGISKFLKRSLVFHILLLSSISLHCSHKKAFLSLLAIPWNSEFRTVKNMPAEPARLHLMSHTLEKISKFRSKRVTLHLNQAVGTQNPLNFRPTKAQKCHLVSKSPGTGTLFTEAALFQGQQHLHSSYWQQWGSASGGEFLEKRGAERNALWSFFWHSLLESIYKEHKVLRGLLPKQPGRSRSSVSALWTIVVTTTSLPELRGPFYSKGRRSCKGHLPCRNRLGAGSWERSQNGEDL